MKIIDDDLPQIELDVIPGLIVAGNSFKKGTVLAKALEVCAAKIEEIPVIVILKTIVQCKEFLRYFRKEKIGTDAYIFDAVGGDSAGAFSILNTIKKKEKEAPYPVVITTGVSSLGFSFFDRAHCILTEMPLDYTQYLQT